MPKIDNDLVSKRSVLVEYGLNSKAVDLLISKGLVRIYRGKVSRKSLRNLREELHYVICRACGAFLMQIAPKHLKSCSGMTLVEYVSKYPNAKIMSGLCSERRKKTEEQKIYQSARLKERFRTPEGDITRRQISEAAKRLQASEYRVRAAEHLRKFNSDPERRRETSERFKSLWQTREFREKQESWRSDNANFVKENAANARRYLVHKITRPHLKFKELLLKAGLKGFQTEYEVGWYAIDEAFPAFKIAVEVDGCYWHGCSSCGFEPYGDNRRLDRRKNTYLRRRGWVVLRIRACDLKRDPQKCVERVSLALKDRHGY